MIGPNFEKVRRFFQKVPMNEMAVTDLVVHSVGILLEKFGRFEMYTSFLRDLGKVSLISLSFDELIEIDKLMKKYNLDFDDAYQYVAAEKYDLVIVSYDSDFDRTLRGRKTPEEILKEMGGDQGVTLEEKIRRLSPEEREIIERLIDVILESNRQDSKLSLSWAGKADRLGYDGVYWQHKVFEWRAEDISR